MHGTVHLFERLPQVEDAPAEAGAPHLAPVERTQPLVGLIRNARSHGNARRSAPRWLPDNVLVENPLKRCELHGILSRFKAAQVDYIAIDGGDGTVRDVLTLGAGIFGASWPTLIVLPTGKTNALGHDLGIPPDWSIEDALVAAGEGKFATRHPIVVEERDDPRNQVHGFVLGAGAFTRAIELGQRGHDLGAFNKAVIVLTTIWSVAQAFVGGPGNPWRKGIKMRVRHGNGEELPHRGGLPEDERYLLFASTLDTFPAGLDPFRRVEHPMGIAMMDSVSLSLIMRLGAIFAGRPGPGTLARGYHVFGEDALEIDLGEKFIFDGEAFPAGEYRLSAGPELRFVVP